VAATTVRYGSRGAEVRRLQELLNNALRPCPHLRVDGHFGPRTETAVRLYQASVGGRIDGVVGTHTWAALEKRLMPGRDESITDPSPANFASAPWMAIALQEIGQSEIKGSDHNPRILEYHATTTLHVTSDEAPWCSSFVNWCLRQAGIAGTNSAAAIGWIHWGKPCGSIVGAVTIIRNPKLAGSSLTASGYHVGFLVQDTGSHYRLLGGNQSDQVKKTYFPKCAWRLIGHRWPR